MRAKGPGAEDVVREALWDGFREQAHTLSQVMDDVFISSSHVATDAYFAVDAYGSQDYMPPTLLAGGGGLWDAFHRSVYATTRSTADATLAVYRLHLRRLATLAEEHGAPLGVALRPRIESLTFPGLTGPSGVDPESSRRGRQPQLFPLQVTASGASAGPRSARSPC